jgi:hypothetical protein
LFRERLASAVYSVMRGVSLMRETWGDDFSYTVSVAIGEEYREHSIPNI